MTLPTVSVHMIGNEREPVAVIENFALDPDALREDAATRAFVAGGHNYPGVRAPVSDDYLPRQRAVLGPVFSEVFGIEDKVSILDVAYSLVTTAPDALTLEQRLPHVDALEPGRLALIHYLVPQGSDGTAFYRHRATSFETVDRPRSKAYFAGLNNDLKRHGDPPAAYLHGNTPIFEQTGHFDGIYNRALVYRSRMLHSGAITPGNAMPADPKTGRLTITGFFAAD